MVLIDLIQATAGDDGFDFCVQCGSTSPTHLGLYADDQLTDIARIAWCDADDCARDRAVSAPNTILVAENGGAYTVRRQP